MKEEKQLYGEKGAAKGDGCGEAGTGATGGERLDTSTAKEPMIQKGGGRGILVADIASKPRAERERELKTGQAKTWGPEKRGKTVPGGNSCKNLFDKEDSRKRWYGCSGSEEYSQEGERDR